MQFSIRFFFKVASVFCFLLLGDSFRPFFVGGKICFNSIQYIYTSLIHCMYDISNYHIIDLCNDFIFDIIYERSQD